MDNNIQELVDQLTTELESGKYFVETDERIDKVYLVDSFGNSVADVENECLTLQMNVGGEMSYVKFNGDGIGTNIIRIARFQKAFQDQQSIQKTLLAIS